MEEEIKKEPKKFPVKLVLALLVIMLIAGGAGASYYFYKQNQASQQLLKDPTAVQKAEVKAVVDKLSKLMELPSGEEPQVATVLDITKLKDQPFFTNAQNGDKVIIYTKAGKAILFRESTNKIIDVSPLNLGQTSESFKIVIYNGTKTAGLTFKFATDIVKISPNITVGVKANAVKSYDKSIVIDLTNKNGLAKQMADLIGATVQPLPEGEVKPTDATTDLLVILGANYTGPAVPPASLPTASPSATPAQ